MKDTRFTSIIDYAAYQFTLHGFGTSLGTWKMGTFTKLKIPDTDDELQKFHLLPEVRRSLLACGPYCIIYENKSENVRVTWFNDIDDFDSEWNAIHTRWIEEG